MDWDAIGAIGELIGAAAVVVTLAYLARQIRQNSLAMKVAAKQEMTKQYGEFADLLNEREAYKYFLLMNKATWYFSSMFYQYKVHELSDQEWSQSQRVIDRYCAMPGFRSYWNENREYWSEDFTEYIDEVVESAT